MTTTLPTPPAPPVALPPERRAAAVDHAWVVGAAILVGGLVTTGLWVRHGGVGAATGPGAVATAAGQLTALLGTYAILVQVLFMSRIAWLERAIGLDHLAVWHRWLGFAAVWLITGHVVFTTLGYATSSHVSLWAQSRDFILNYADVPIAWAGFVLLLAIAFTSVRAARRKLRRETWFFIHLGAYLAILLSFAHQLAVGTDFDGDRAARVWWVGLFVLVGAAILWWRLVVPIVANAQHRLRVHTVHNEASGVVSLYLEGKHVDRMGVEPGQWFLFRFLTPGRWWKTHPFSLSAAPTPHFMRVTVKDLGDDTRKFPQLPAGTRVLVEGPYGTFTESRRTRRRVLLIAGGIGITPLRAMLDAFDRNVDVVLLYRVATRAEIVFEDELRKFARAPNRTLHIIVGNTIGDDQTDLLSIPALARGVPDIAARECFVCGPPAMIAALRSRLEQLGVARSRIHFERFEF